MDKNLKYTQILKQQLKNFKDENRFLEFKSNYQDAIRLGKYISSLSNGACLDRQDFAYLYFGIDDKTHEVKGTTFDIANIKAQGNQSLEIYLRQYIQPRINFVIEEFLFEGITRVVLFKIPAAVGEPTVFMNKPYVRVDSHVTELSLYTHWMREIYTSRLDWTAQVIEDATIDDLDAEAILLARKGYKLRNPDYAEEMENWSDEVFLDKANLTQDGQVTRATMLLVGRREKAHKIGHIAQLVWKCFQEGETFGDTFTIPFIKTTSELLGRIRNYRFKIYPHNSLIPAEIWKYDTRSILEGLHNCIAHQDYVLDERVVITEDKEKLTFENAGGFFEGDYEQYIAGTKTPKRYRNPFLMKAMVSVKMIDSQGYGIHNMFVRQKERYLPMPDYEGTTEDHVVMHMPGTVIDENYSLMLMSHNDINLTEAVLLDQLQKGRMIKDNAIDMLRKRHLVEGRKPNIYIAKLVAQSTDQKIEYSKHKGLDDKSCEAMLLEALRDHGKLTRGEIDKLLWSVLSDQLDEKQKKIKIANLLTKLKKKEVIDNNTRGNISEWWACK